jgi:CMP-N-acetylneuraminic acid synthetase
MKIVAFVPIRLNSKRVAGKNLKLLGNKPLFLYILETLISIEKINEKYVFCSSEDIISFLPEGIKFLKRNENLDKDETLGWEIYDSFVNKINADIYILAHATSPYIKKETIENAIKKILDEGYDSAFCAEKKQTFVWYNDHPLNYDLKSIPRTQEINPVFIETSAFYMFKREIWIENKQRIGFNPYIAVVDQIEGVDIDNPEDFKFAEIVNQYIF